MFEVEICASNGRFAGRARCYTTREQITELARGVDGFPKSTFDAFHFSTHSGDHFSYFGFNFRCVDGRGGVIVRVKVVDIVRFSNSPGIDNFVEFDLGVEPAAIDNFSNELVALAKATIGENRRSCMQRHNISVHTDKQHQIAASRRVLCAGDRQC